MRNVFKLQTALNPVNIKGVHNEFVRHTPIKINKISIITIIIIMSTIIIIYYIIPHNRKQAGVHASKQGEGGMYMLINHKAIHGITVGYTLLVKQLHPFIVSRYCYC